MKKKLLLMFATITILMLLTSCQKKKETVVEFENIGAFIENASKWDFKEDNFKDSTFERSEDESYNVSYGGYAAVANIEKVYCSYDFENNKMVRAQLIFTADNSKDGIQMAKDVIRQLDDSCNIFIQEASTTDIQDYLSDPLFYFRLNNDVDPMGNIKNIINEKVDGGDHVRIYKSKNGEFKDLKFSCQTRSDSDGAIIFVTMSNLKNDAMTAHYSEDE